MNTVTASVSPVRSLTLSRLAFRDWWIENVILPMPVSLVVFTLVRTLKTGPLASPFYQVWKLNRVWGFVATRYERAVNAQLAREGEATGFVALPPPSGYHYVAPSLVQFGNGNFALPMQFNSQLRQAGTPRYFVRPSRLAPLRLVDNATVAPFLPVRAEGERQGTESPVVWRTYGLDSVLRCVAKGNAIRIRGHA